MFRHITFVALSAAALAMPMAASAAPKGCPPGLAKKNAACMPPGQAKKMDIRRDHDHDRDRDREEVRVIHHYQVGDRYDGDRIIIRDPSRYGLSPAYTYYRNDDIIYRVDPETRQVLNVIGAISSLLN